MWITNQDQGLFRYLYENKVALAQQIQRDIYRKKHFQFEVKQFTLGADANDERTDKLARQIIRIVEETRKRPRAMPFPINQITGKLTKTKRLTLS